MTLDKLLTEQSNPVSHSIDSLPAASILTIINEQDKLVAEAVAKEIPRIAKAVDGIVIAIERGGRLFYIGAGTSGRLGVLDAAECPPTFSVPPELVQGIMAGGESALSKATEATEDDPAMGERDLLARGFTGKDALVGIAASGRTPYVLGAVKKAREMGALTIGISCTPQSDLSSAVEIPIEPLSGPEVLAGSTRMKAGTATKLVLNMLSTAAMIRLGYVYGNLMVNLHPKNRKLLDRASRIIAQAANIEYSRASELLEQTGSVKTSIVMAKRNLSREEAEQLLQTANGRVRVALES